MDKVDDKRTAILAATLRLVSEHGFHGTAMSKVAKEAGVSAGIIYHYFDSKDALINEVYRSIKQKSAQAILAGFDTTQPLRSQIRYIMGSMIRYYIHRPQESAFIEQYTRSPYYQVEMEAAMSDYYQPIIHCLMQAQAEMIIKPFPPAVTSALTVDVATSLAQKQAIGLVTLTDELIEQIIDALWEAVRQ